MIYNESVNVILSTNLRPKRVDGDLLHQILSVLRSPDSSILDCVVPNLDLRSVVPNTRLSTRSPEIIHRGRTYVDRVRTSIVYVRGYARRRKTRTLVDHIRRKTRMCIVEICSRDMRTLSDHVRQARTYAGGRRTRKSTSPNLYSRLSISESPSPWW